ncbi:MAG: hypothetical protein HC904_01150 [Blastochloris sp.]|nr:hypothetical protein [Blastochloris sp.]
MSPSEIKLKLKEKEEEREKIYQEIAKVSAERSRFLAEEKKKEGASGAKDSFDEKVGILVREQGSKVFEK